jgi:DNA topoisomerase-6 subunit A
MTSNDHGTEDRLDNDAVAELYEIANSIYDQLSAGKVPKMVIPLRTKSNIRFDPKLGVWKYGKAAGSCVRCTSSSS